MNFHSTIAAPASMIDQFAEELAEHGCIRKASANLGIDSRAGKCLFDAICIQLGPQAFDRMIHPTVNEIQAATANYFHIDAMEMHSHRRSREVARPRQVAMYLAKRKTPFSLPMIGRLFGGRDHTTVIHAVKRVKELIASNAGIAAAVRELEARL